MDEMKENIEPEDAQFNPDERGIMDNISSIAGKLGDAAKKYIGEKLGVKLDKENEDSKDKDKEEEEKPKKKKGGSCGGGSNQGDQSSDSAPGTCDGTSPSELGDVGMEDVDESTNSMCKKIYTVYRCIFKDFECPTS